MRSPEGELSDTSPQCRIASLNSPSGDPILQWHHIFRPVHNFSVTETSDVKREINSDHYGTNSVNQSSEDTVNQSSEGTTHDRDNVGKFVGLWECGKGKLEERIQDTASDDNERENPIWHYINTSEALDSFALQVGGDNQSCLESAQPGIMVDQKVENCERLTENQPELSLDVKLKDKSMNILIKPASDDNFQCGICHKLYTSASGVKCHLMSHVVQAYTCPICDKNFPHMDVRKLKRHIKVHKSKGEITEEVKMNFHFNDKDDMEYSILNAAKNILKPDDTGKNVSASDGSIPDGSSPSLEHIYGEVLLPENSEHREPLNSIQIQKVNFYECNICKKKFTTKLKLNGHKGNHSNHTAGAGAAYSCKVCGKAFRTKPGLVRHTRSHTGQEPFSCDICSLKFSQKGNLTRHMLVHTGEEPYKCDLCDFTFSQKNNLKRHQLTHNKTPKPYECSKCARKFKKKVSLKSHLRHCGQEEFRCTLCGEILPTIGLLKGHRKREHAHELKLQHEDKIKIREEKPFKCEKCPSRWRNNHALMKHIRRCHKEEPSVFLCEHCNEVFPIYNQLKQHRRRNHDHRIFKCDDCLNTFASIGSLRRHLGTHKKVENKYQCDVCGLGFYRKDNHVRHMKTHTSSTGKRKIKKPKKENGEAESEVIITEVKLKSHDLGKKLKSKTTKSATVIRKSKKNRGLSCGVCSDTFISENDLDLHLHIHEVSSAVNEHACEKCSEVFSSEFELTEHDVVHTSNAVCVCSTCGESFLHETELLEHGKTHMKRKPRASTLYHGDEWEVSPNVRRTSSNKKENVQSNSAPKSTGSSKISALKKSIPKKKIKTSDDSSKKVKKISQKSGLSKKAQNVKSKSTKAKVKKVKNSKKGTVPSTLKSQPDVSLVDSIKNEDPEAIKDIRKTIYVCQVCLRPFKTMESLLQHHETHVKTEPIVEINL